MIDIALSMDGREGDLESLEEWLRSEDGLRGRIDRGNCEKPVGTMGGTTDVIVTLATSGTLSVVARSVQVWLTQRKPDLVVDIRSPNGKRMTVTAQKVKDPDDLVHDMLESFDSDSGHPDGTAGRE